MKNPDAYYRKLTKMIYYHQKWMVENGFVAGTLTGYSKGLMAARAKYRLFLNKKRVSRRRK